MSLVFGLLLVGFGWFWMRFMKKRRDTKNSSEAELQKELPDLIDLIAIAVGSGLTIRPALEVVTEGIENEVLPKSKKALEDILKSIRLGNPLATVLTNSPKSLAPLLIPMIESDSYGAELLPALHQAGAEARQTNLRKAEVSARKVPIKLLFPLVVCILPAFGLLTIVPVLVRSLQSIIP